MQIIKELMYKLSTTAAIVWGIFSYVASYVASSVLLLFVYDKLYVLINKSKLR